MSMTPKELIKAVYEIAYGEDAYLRGFFQRKLLRDYKNFQMVQIQF